MSWLYSGVEYYFQDDKGKDNMVYERFFEPEDDLQLMYLNDSIKIWLDDERDAPDGYIHCHSVNETINTIQFYEKYSVAIEELNLDHDLGVYAKDGGDAIKLIDWLCMRETGSLWKSY